MIQDIAPKKLYNEYTQKNPLPTDRMMLFCENKILIKELGGCMKLPTRMEFETLGGYSQDTSAAVIGKQQYLFRIEEDCYFRYPAFAELETGLQNALQLDGTDFHWVSLSQIRGCQDRELCFAVYTAYHLEQWYQSHVFCGCCGARTVPDTRERMLRCPVCGSQSYPVIAPAVIAAVTDGDKILLTKYANREYKRYALIAGFTEIGETAEETVRREVMEETGIQVKNIRYYKSQPWGIDGNLLLGFFAELDGSSRISLDENELAAAEWVNRDRLKDMDDSFSLTREMMRVFCENRI